MKLFKKVIAAALAGMLALSVLTGCGSGSGTSTASIVDALNDWAKLDGAGVTYSAGSSDLKAKAEAAKDAAELYTGEMNESAVNTILQNIKTKLNLTTVVSVGDDLYEIGFTEIGQSLNADKSKNVYYAMAAMENSMELNTAEGSAWTTGNKVEVAATTCKVGGKKYLLVLFKSNATSNGESGNRGES